MQIADMGLTTFHEQDLSTRIRRAANLYTATPPGTSRYEPPETDQDRYDDQDNSEKDRIRNPEEHEARSRAYDIWSMGCVVLELLIWLFYGSDTVNKFRKKTPYLWERHGGEYRIHKLAQEHIEEMSKTWKRNSACGDLLKFVLDRLLVIKVSENNESSSDHREIAAAAWGKMREIERKHYLARTTDNGLAPGHENDYRVIKTSLPTREDNLEEFGSLVGIQRKATEEQKQASEEEQPDTGRTLVPGKEYQWNSKHEKQRSKLNDVWESLPDNTFASQVFEHISWYQVKPLSTKEDNIVCEDCRTMTSTTLFESERHTATMRQSCKVCVLLLDALRTAGVTSSGVVRLRQTSTTVGLENGPNLLSIYTEPGPDVPQGRQIGLPQLPEPNSEEQLTLLKQWIRSCDSTHSACHRDAEPITDMPTRIVKVTEPIQLLTSSSIGPCRYIALSHCWGRLQEHERFCLYRNNFSQLQECIDLNRLPKTFRDAIVLTRGLGIDYIWIDTLCIIQDDKDDWENESTKMEEVFSAAYCTISAASAKSSLDGFLSHRSPRPCVQLHMEGSRDLYVCSHIDNFHQDVELAEINQRGWVLQERALSRRSIYYSSTQVYWECGEGIRCETLSRLYNSKAAFLGDANFPKFALNYYRDGRQLLIQDLYERYSALAFTMASDRAIAILGLQKRLERAFKTQAAHGSFEVYFARSILWKRDQPTAMTAIAQPTGRHVPSWSWFSKGGKIEYMHLSFDKIDWMNDDFESPFAHQRDVLSGCRCENRLILRGLARGMNLSDKELAERVIFDENNELKVKDLRAVAIGRDKDEGIAYTRLNSPRVHVLVIRESTSDSSERIYERVGVASLLPMQVLAEGIWVNVW
ncbi:heterokaryon incompatibility protein [Colletotrichum incanum]|nr:heterokaryon incompatibility protein [Colletotrichum incanum]